MDVKGESPEVSVPKKGRIAPLTITGRWVNVLMQTTMVAILVSATLPSGEVYGHPRGELPDPCSYTTGRAKERENLRKF